MGIFKLMAKKFDLNKIHPEIFTFALKVLNQGILTDPDKVDTDPDLQNKPGSASDPRKKTHRNWNLHLCLILSSVKTATVKYDLSPEDGLTLNPVQVAVE